MDLHSYKEKCRGKWLLEHAKFYCKGDELPSQKKRKISATRSFCNNYFDTLNAQFFGGYLNSKNVLFKVVFSGEWKYVISKEKDSVCWFLDTQSGRKARIFINIKWADNKLYRIKLKELVAHEMVHAFLYIKNKRGVIGEEPHPKDFLKLCQKIANFDKEVQFNIHTNKGWIFIKHSIRCKPKTRI